MRLTAHTDYGLRVLMTLAALNDRVVAVDEFAKRHRLSKDHLMKVAQTLVRAGVVRTIRGRAGGLQLAKDPAEIQMGAVTRALEGDCSLVECLGKGPTGCVLAGACRLTHSLARALEAFFDELDKVTLADLVATHPAMRERLGLPAERNAPESGVIAFGSLDR